MEQTTSTTSCTLCLTGPIELRRSSMLNSGTWLSTVTKIQDTRASDSKPAHMDCLHVRYSRPASRRGFISCPGLAAFWVGAHIAHSFAEERARFLGRRPHEKPGLCIPPWAGGIPPRAIVGETCIQHCKCATFLQNLAHDENTGLVL